MKVIKNFFWNAGYQLFVLLVPLVTIPYVNRVLGPTGIGINSYTNSIVQYFILFGSLGVNMYGNREIAYTRDSPKRMSKTFWEIAIMRMISIGLAIIAYFVFILLSKQYRFFYVIQGIALVGAAFDVSWLFQGLENFRVTVLRNAFVKIIGLILIFSFVKTAADTWIYVLILAASQTIGYLTLWPQLRHLVDPVKLKSLNLIRHIRPSLTLLVPQIATQVYLQLNKTMLGVLRGVEASGFYDNSDKIVKMVLAIITATGTVLLPHVAHSFAAGDHKAVEHSLEVSMHVILVLVFPMAFGLAAVSGPFTTLFFSTKFATVASLMSVESLVIIFIGISNAVGTQYLLPTNQLSAYSTSVIVGSLINIVLNVPLILMWGTMGSIWATVLSELSVSLYQLFKIKNQVELGTLFQESWKYLISGVVMFVVTKKWLMGLPVTVWAVASAVAIGIITYTGVLMILRPKVLLKYIDDFISR